MSDEFDKITPAEVTELCDASKFHITVSLAQLALAEEELPADDLSLVRQLLATAIRQITAMHTRKIN